MSKEWVEIEDTINYITEHIEIRNCSAEWVVNKLNEQADRIAELGKEIAIRNQKLNELKNELHKRDESLQRKKQQVEDVHKAVHQAKKESAKKGRQVCRANNEVVQYRKQILKLEEQLKNAIVPKFKRGQECYLIDDNFNYFHNRKEYNIVRSKIRKHKNVYYIEDYGINHEEDLFATKEEAEAKLEELKGE